MHLAIDWVAMAVIIAAVIFGQLRFVPIRIRFGGVALAMFAVAAYKMRSGGMQGPNLIFVVLAVGWGISYVVRAIRAR